MIEHADLEKRRLLIQYFAFILGVAATFGSYSSLFFFLSSIHIESGVGLSAAVTAYVVSGLFTIVGTPVVIQEVGAKTAIVACHFGFIAYAVANFYPRFYTLIPAALLAGAGEAVMLPLMFIFSVHFARCYSRLHSRHRDFYQAKFLGCQWFAFKFFMVLCSLTNYGILYAGKAPDASVGLNGTRSQRLLRVCGINDCQDSNLTALNIDQYAPDPRTTYIVFGVIVALTLGGAIDHSLVLKKMDRSLEAKTCPRKKSRSLSVISFGENLANKTATDLCKKVEEIDGVAEEKTTEDLATNVFRILRLVLKTSKSTFLNMIKPRQLLITPLAIIGGLQPGFVHSELSRAFASCLLGVDKVGLCAALYGLLVALGSLLTGKLISSFGRIKPQMFAVLLCLTNYALILTWTPTAGSTWMVYSFFALFGVVDSIWNVCSTDLYAAYFSNDQDIAYSLWTLWHFCGYAIQFGWSTRICVREKIYIQIGLLLFATLCYLYAEFREKRSKSKHVASKTLQRISNNRK